MPPTLTGDTQKDVARLSDYVRTLVEQINAMIAEINRKNGG